MMSISLGTMLFGLTEPLFVPAYWNPPSLFDLAQRTGFDIESFIFTFAIAGTSSVLYRVIYKRNVEKMDAAEMAHSRHKFHVYFLTSPIPIFLALAIFTKLNHIYCGIIAMFAGALLTLYCRPDLRWKIWIEGTRCSCAAHDNRYSARNISVDTSTSDKCVIEPSRRFCPEIRNEFSCCEVKSMRRSE